MKGFIDNIFTTLVFKYLSKGLTYLSEKDDEVRSLIARIPNDTNLRFSVLGSNRYLVMKIQDSELRTFKKNSEPAQIDLEIVFKFFGSLVKILKCKNSVQTAYHNKEFIVKGELNYIMPIVYAVEKFMAYMFSRKKHKRVYETRASFTISKAKMHMNLIFARRKYC